MCTPVLLLRARVDGLIYSLLYISWSCGSCIWPFTAMLRFSCPQISITVNVKCHCQWNLANQLPGTSGNIGRSWCKSSSEVWFGPGLKNNFMVMTNVDSTAKNRAFKFQLCWSQIFHIHMSVNRPLSLRDSCVFLFLFNYLHLLYKSGEHWANTHWIKFPKQQVVGVGFPLYCINAFHYCITVTWHIGTSITKLHPQPVIHPQAVVCNSTADKSNLILIDYWVQLNIALLSVGSFQLVFTLPISAAQKFSFLFREDGVQHPD